MSSCTTIEIVIMRCRDAALARARASKSAEYHEADGDTDAFEAGRRHALMMLLMMVVTMVMLGMGQTIAVLPCAAWVQIWYSTMFSPGGAPNMEPYHIAQC